MASVLQTTSGEVNTTVTSAFVLNNKASGKLPGALGYIFSAVITSMNRQENKLSLTAKTGASFEADAGTVQGGIGDEVYFKVLQNDGGQTLLKQIFPQDVQRAAQAMQSDKNVMDLYKQSGFAREENVLNARDNSQDDYQKAMLAAQQIKRRLAYASGGLSRSAIQELVASGLSLEKISLNILTSVMSEVEEHTPPTISDEEADAAVAQYMQNNKGTGAPTAPEHSAAKALASQGIPVTPKNIQKLTLALSKWQNVKTMDDTTIVKILQSGKDLTLENAYVAKYSSSTQPFDDPDAMDEDTWAALQPGLAETFARESIAETDGNQERAKLLISNHIAVTRENMDKTAHLQNLDTALTEDDIAAKAAEAIRKGQRPGDVPLLGGGAPPQALTEHYGKLLAEVPEIPEVRVTQLVRANIPLTLHRLRNINGVLPAAANEAQPALDTRQTEVSLAGKRLLAEIQLKLTKEAAYRLAGKGIDIDTLPLQQAVAALRQAESDGYAKSLRIMGGADTEQNIRALRGVYDGLSTIRAAGDAGYASVLQGRAPLTINGVHAAVRALEGYEPFQTTPLSQYGDSFAKIRGQFAGLLADMELEASTQNIRAAEILSRSHMDINPENLEQIKLLDAKLQRVSNALHPHIAANMLKEGLNPAEMHVDEVLSYIDKFKDVFGEDLGDKIASFITEMDENRTLDSNTRQSMMAVYRMLHQIQKDGGVSLGLTFKRNGDYTLGSLLEASQTYQRTRGRQGAYDLTVNDEFGSLEEVRGGQNTIRGLLAKAQAQAYRAMSPENRERADNLLNGHTYAPTADNLSILQKVSDSGFEESALREAAYHKIVFTNITEAAAPEALAVLLENGAGVETGRAASPTSSQTAATVTTGDNTGVSPNIFNVSDISDITIEEMERRLQHLAADAKAPGESQTAQYARQAQAFATLPASAGQWMEARGLTLSLAHVTAMRQMLGDAHFTGKKSAALEQNLRNSGNIDAAERLRAAYPDTALTALRSGRPPEDVLQGMQQALQEASSESTTPELTKDLAVIQNAVQIQSRAYQNPQNKGFSLPIALNGKTASLNMYVLNENLDAQDAANVFISLQTGQLGDVQVWLQTNQNSATLQIRADAEDTLALLRQNEPLLRTLAAEAGFEITGLSFGQAQAKRNVLAEEVAGAEPAKLNAAKTLSEYDYHV